MPRLSSHFGLQDPRLQSLVMPLIVPVSIATAGNVTLTAAQLLGGLIIRDGNGGARSDNLPTAALLVDAIQGAMVGTSFQCEFRNSTGTAVAITLVAPAGSGATISGTATVAQLNTKTLLFVLTNVTIGSEAYTVYSLGSAVF